MFTFLSANLFCNRISKLLYTSQLFCEPESFAMVCVHDHAGPYCGYICRNVLQHFYMYVHMYIIAINCIDIAALFTK